jgi:CheY-like chemotaxis protein
VLHQDAPCLRVLIADDNRDTVMTLGILLRSEGFDVNLVEGGGANVPNAVDEFQPHVVLLDIVMPDRSGLELARQLKRRYADRCPVLIAITGHVSEEAQRDAALSGFTHFIAKPYDPDALLKLVASFKTPKAADTCDQLPPGRHGDVAA